MRIFVFVFIFLILLQNKASAYEATVWDYDRDDFVRNILIDSYTVFDKHRQEKIDRELERILNVKLIPTDLSYCLNAAVQYNYMIKTKKHTEKENLWYQRYGYSKFLPDISYNYNIQWLSGTYLVGGIIPDRVNEAPIQSFFDFEWSLFDRGKTFLYIIQRNNLYKAAKELHEFTRDEIILKTAQTYYELTQKKAELDIYTSNVTDRRAQSALTKARYEVGEGTRFDIYRAEAEAAKAEQEYISAFNSVRITQAKLANLTGIDVLTPLYPAASVIAPKTLTNENIENLIQYARKYRKDYAATIHQIKALKAEKNSKYTEFVPDISIKYQSAMYGTKRRGLYPSNTFAVNVSVPLGEKSGVGTFTQIKAYNEKIKAEEYNLIQMIRNIDESIVKSVQESKSAFERISASKEEVYAAEKSLENSIVLMNEGLSTFIDVIQAQNIKVNAQIGLAENITEYNKSQVQILFDSGIISTDSVINGYKRP